MIRLALAPLLLVALLGPARAEDGAIDDGWIDLDGATVVASPGIPEAVHDLLPGGRAPQPLTWPLPRGPLLVLGLPDEDEIAADLAGLLHLLPPSGDLHGGYVVHAWHDGSRPIAAIFAADGVALRAACEDLPSPLRMRARRHHERPRYRVRALVGMWPPEEALRWAIDGRANRLWMDLERWTPKDIDEALPRLAHQGIQPVLVATDSKGFERRVVEGIRRHGVRRLAVWSATPRPTGGWETLARLTETLRRAGLKTDALTVVPGRCEEDGDLPDLSGIEGATLGWTGRRGQGAGVSLADARSMRRRQAVPVSFVEFWAGPGSLPVAPQCQAPWIPTRPRGRDPRLGEVLSGIVVVGGPGSELGLREAWHGPPKDTRDAWETTLLPLLPRGPLAPRVFFEQSAARLEVAARAADAAPWMAPLATWLAAEAPRLPESAIPVPRIPTRAVCDNVLDEAAWAYAARRHVRFPTAGRNEEVVWKEIVLLAYSTGRTLFVAARAPAVLGHLTLQVSLREEGPVTPRQHRGVLTWEWAVERDWMGVDAYPTRQLDIRLRSLRLPILEETLVLMP